MIRFVLREVAGWVLVLIGLGIIILCVLALFQPRPKILQSGPLTLMGVIVFRGGIHLLKVAVAARVCLEARKTLDRET